MSLVRALFQLLLLPMLLSFAARSVAGPAQGKMLQVPTRDGSSVTVFWAEREQARATVLLFPGGGGGFGRLVDGRPQGGNFLVRSSAAFQAAGYQVAIFGRRADGAELGYEDRILPAHLADIADVVAALKARSDRPLWLVGTSRGTISAASGAIALGDQIAGLVLSSSIVAMKKPGALPSLDLAAIRKPVLLLHHEKDACWVCKPQEVPALLQRFSGAPVKRLIWADGGGPASGEPCEPQHWHGFVGLEAEAVGLITDWLAEPR